MEKNDLLKHIAQTGYNVGYTAKLHFASYEMIEKVPGLISIISMAFGIYALAYDGLSTKFISSTLLVLGIIGLYVSIRNGDKGDYQTKGIELTNIFNKLKHLINDVKHEAGDLTPLSVQLRDIETEYNNNCAPQHIMFATWFAHYKFFWEQQTGWIEEYRKFGFFRDKLPLTFWIALVTLLAYLALNFTETVNFICSVRNSL
jgi:hypothetical protein